MKRLRRIRVTIVAVAVAVLIAIVASIVASLQRQFEAGAMIAIAALLIALLALALLAREIERPARAGEEDPTRSHAASEERQASGPVLGAGTARSTFLANMSHELRSPLNSIIGFSELLAKQADGPLSSRQVRQAENILASGKHLLQLVNEILDWAKIDAGQVQLQRAPVEVLPLLDSCRMSIEPVAAKKNVSVTFEAADPSGSPLPSVFADGVKMRQIVDNLLSNAVKFAGENGHVHLTARAEGGEAAERGGQDPAFVEFAVVDDGIGIASADLERIFEAFVQVDPSQARRAEGAGLGLAVARKLVELQGGKIWVESEPGRGSCFRFRIPIAKSKLENAS